MSNLLTLFAYRGSNSGVSSAPLNLTSYLWRNFATTLHRANEYEMWVPYEQTNGTTRYACFGFNTYIGTTYLLGRVRHGIPALFTPHASLTKTGTWTSSPNTAGYGGSAIYSTTYGENVSGTITGHTLFLRTARLSNGGFGVITINNGTTAANRLPIINAGSYINITGAANNGSGLIRLTTATAHGLATGAVIWIENVGGVTAANGRFGVTVINATTLDLVGSTFSGTYTAATGTLGYFKQADAGKRYINTYSPASLWDEFIPLADGLPDTSYSVQIMATGTAQAGTITGGRCYITAFAGAAANMTPNQTANHGMAYDLYIYDQRLITASSAFGTAVTFKPDSGTNYTFIGDIHGFENQTSWSFEVDGTPTTLTGNQIVSGAQVKAIAVGTLTHPDTGATVMANKTINYIGEAYTNYQLRLESEISWQQPGTAVESYHGMFPVANYPINTTTQTIFTSATIGSTTIPTLQDDNDTQKGAIEASSVEFISSATNVRPSISIDPLFNVNNWARSAPTNAMLHDRSDKIDKAYFARSTTTNPETISASDIHAGKSKYRLRRAIIQTPPMLPWEFNNLDKGFVYGYPMDNTLSGSPAMTTDFTNTNDLALTTTSPTPIFDSFSGFTGVKFDGGGGILKRASGMIFGGGVCSFACHVRVHNAASLNSQMFYYFNKSGTGASGFYKEHSGLGNRIATAAQLASWPTATSLGINDTNWHFLAWTVDNTTYKFYVDGQPAGTVTGGAQFALGGGPIKFGQYTAADTSTGDFVMRIPMLWNRVLSDAEVLALYNAGNPLHPLS